MPELRFTVPVWSGEPTYSLTIGRMRLTRLAIIVVVALKYGLDEFLTGHERFRAVRPLALQFWGQVWTLAAWCELREDFRTFRVDRVERLEVTETRFEREAGRALEDYLARITRAP